MLKRLHAAAGALALLILASFWVATLIAECFLPASSVIAVKGGIVAGLFLLVPVMAMTGMTGAALARGRRDQLVATKIRRMRILAGNGVLLMIPAALFLNAKAAAGEMDALFFLVQAIELSLGLAQIILIIMNLRDGFRMTRAGPAAPGRPLAVGR